jgi:FtsH-binding integral membrane protein
MGYRKLGFGLLGVTFACWIVTFIGWLTGGSQRWTEPFQQIGWMFFVAGFLVLYLLAGREIINPTMARVAWISGAVAIVLWFIALIFYAVSSAPKMWYEAFEAAGAICMLITVMTAIWSVGGYKNEQAKKPADKDQSL